MSSPAVFLDRDGTLNEDVGYLSRPEEVHILPGVPEALADLRSAGYLLVVVTNQSGIGRGYYTEEEYRSVDEAVREGLGLEPDLVLHCPHAPGAKCSCRKPAPGMLRRASRELGIDLGRSFMVGDRERDTAAGAAAGCRPILLTDGPAPAGVRAAADLSAAVELILAEEP